MIKDLHRFIKYFVIKYYEIIRKLEGGSLSIKFNSLKNPSHSDKFYMSNFVFLCENDPVLLIFFWGGPQTPPPHLPQCSFTMLKKRHKQTVIKRIKLLV